MLIIIYSYAAAKHECFIQVEYLIFNKMTTDCPFVIRLCGFLLEDNQSVLLLILQSMQW